MIHIFLETSKENNEYNFIQSLISNFYNKECNKDYIIITVGGKDKLEKNKNKFFDHDNFSEKNAVIFDADFPLNQRDDNGGFSKRFVYLKEKIQSFDSKNPTDIFLFPNNHDDGTFEHLLEKIVQPEHKCILEFFKNYEDDLNSCKDENGNCKYNAPDQKTKMYSYAAAVKIRTKSEYEDFKKGNWSFLDKKYWNLDSEYLKPLKDFLKSLFES